MESRMKMLCMLVLIWQFTCVCCLMLCYTTPFVPADFRFGIIKPLLKNKHGDQSKAKMYRGITLTPVISKLFESVLLSLYGSFFVQ